MSTNNGRPAVPQWMLDQLDQWLPFTPTKPGPPEPESSITGSDFTDRMLIVHMNGVATTHSKLDRLGIPSGRCGAPTSVARLHERMNFLADELLRLRACAAGSERGE